MPKRQTLALVEDVVAERDPAVRLRIIRARMGEVEEISTVLRDLQREAIGDLRDAGWTWDAVGQALGVSAQRASQLR